MDKLTNNEPQHMQKGKNKDLTASLSNRYNKHKLLTNQVLTLGALSQEAGLVESYLGIEFHPVRV